MPSIVLDGNSLTFEQAIAIAQGAQVVLSEKARAGVETARKAVEAIVQEGRPVYGVNTGFGYFASRSINHESLLELQENILESHAAGYGQPFSLPETRLCMALRLNSLLKGLSGVRYVICETLAALINHEVYPVIPEYGSVGASGDLASLAHLALPLVGKGTVSYQGQLMPAEEALKAIGIKPLRLAEKEGLGLINGTQVMTAIGLLNSVEADGIALLADVVAAQTYEALVAHVAPLDPRLHEARGQVGQILSAQAILDALAGSYLHMPSLERTKVQDAYSLRCAPQVHGASRDALAFVKQTLMRELNAATDNPLIFANGDAVSGGNFHGQPLAFACDIATMALSEIANISERRLEQLLNPHRSDLHAFLAPREGVESGYMAVQYLSASLLSEIKLLANPASTDSIPGNIGVEDHVSMGMTSARKLRRVVPLVRTVLAIEAIAAAQAIDLRKCGPLGVRSGALYRALRAKIPTLSKDRIVSEDVRLAVEVLRAFL